MCVCMCVPKSSTSKVGLYSRSDSIWLGPRLQRIGFRGLAGMITIGVRSWVMLSVCPRKDRNVRMCVCVCVQQMH